MAHAHTTPRLYQAKEALTTLFCLVDDAYRLLNPGWQSHEALKKLSDSEVLALALFLAVQEHGERTLLPARRPAVLLTPVPRSRGACPLFVAPPPA